MKSIKTEASSGAGAQSVTLKSIGRGFDRHSSKLNIFFFALPRQQSEE